MPSGALAMFMMKPSSGACDERCFPDMCGASSAAKALQQRELERHRLC
jgi:hypothetical protein